MEDWITTFEASEFTGYHQEYLRELIRSGRVKGRKFGNVWQVSRQSIQEYLAEASKRQDKRFGPRSS